MVTRRDYAIAVVSGVAMFLVMMVFLTMALGHGR